MCSLSNHLIKVWLSNSLFLLSHRWNLSWADLHLLFLYDLHLVWDIIFRFSLYLFSFKLLLRHSLILLLSLKCSSLFSLFLLLYLQPRLFLLLFFFLFLATSFTFVIFVALDYVWNLKSTLWIFRASARFFFSLFNHLESSNEVPLENHLGN